MINTTRTMTAQSPAFGMPAYGHRSVEPISVVRVAVPATAVAQVSTCARIRLEGGMGLVAGTKGDFPGTRAWRPPTC
jgi:hypothetical protein